MDVGHRIRVGKACFTCRRMRRKCSGEAQGCSHCRKYGYECTYDSISRRGRGRKPRTGAGKTERQQSPAKRKAPLSDHGSQTLTDSGGDEEEDEEGDTARFVTGKTSNDDFFVKIYGGSSRWRNGTDSAEFNIDNCNTSLTFRHVNPYYLPPKALALQFISQYFSTIHAAYPFIDQTDFMNSYNECCADPLRGTRADPSMIIMLNLVLGLGAYYARNEDEDTVVPDFTPDDYFCRARVLFPDVFDTSSPEMVQCYLLSCFYLLVSGKNDRCWTTLGLAIRVAQDIGLHQEGPLKCSHKGLSLERRKRIWYSLYILELLCCCMLGRSSMIPNSSSLGLPIDDGSEMTISYFIQMVKFSQIIESVLADLYPEQPKSRKLSFIVEVVSDIDYALLSWKNALPHHLDFDAAHSCKVSPIFHRLRNNLATKFHNLRVITNRISLTLHDNSLKYLTSQQREVIHRSRETCISSAKAFVSTLNKVTDISSLKQDFPSWQLLSCIMASASVLMLCAKTQKDRVDRSLLLQDAQVCGRIFELFSRKNVLAERCLMLLRQLEIFEFDVPESQDVKPPQEGDRVSFSEQFYANTPPFADGVHPDDFNSLSRIVEGQPYDPFEWTQFVFSGVDVRGGIGNGGA